MPTPNVPGESHCASGGSSIAGTKTEERRFTQRLRYNLRDFNFPAIVASIFDVGDLSSLQPAPGLALLTRETDQDPAHYRIFYSSFGQLRDVYDEFVANVASPLLGEPYCYQTIPTLRIHYHNNVAVGEFHKDSDYNHPDGEVNFWVPLTPAWGSNTLWLEYEADGVEPIEARPGEVVVFDAVNLRHGNKVNTTGSTRVSFDFRCVPLSRYRSSDRRSVNSGKRFTIGEYYRLP